MDNYKNNYFGDVEDRLSLRESLQFKNFEWYLKNQMPHLLDNKIIDAGEIRNFHQHQEREEEGLMVTRMKGTMDVWPETLLERM